MTRRRSKKKVERKEEEEEQASIVNEASEDENNAEVENDTKPENKTEEENEESSDNEKGTSKSSAMQERLLKFQKLQKARQSAIVSNLSSVKQEVITEEARKKGLNDPHKLAKLERQKQKAESFLKARELEAQGIDPKREQLKEFTIEQVEKWKIKNEGKQAGRDVGFTDHLDFSYRKYERQIRENFGDQVVRKIKEDSEKQPGPASGSVQEILEYVQKGNNSHLASTSAGANRIVSDLEKEEQRRSQFSKRRAYKDDEDVTFINARNERFNKKIARAYDPYTKEIKESLERGTAL